jgi:hypothetical protein
MLYKVKAKWHLSPTTFRGIRRAPFSPLAHDPALSRALPLARATPSPAAPQQQQQHHVGRRVTECRRYSLSPTYLLYAKVGLKLPNRFWIHEDLPPFCPAVHCSEKKCAEKCFIGCK